jgi:hypothetical protein
VTFRLSELEYRSLKMACGMERNSVSAMALRSGLEWTDFKLRPVPDANLVEIGEKLDALLQVLTTGPNGR